jgi:transposase
MRYEFLPPYSPDYNPIELAFSYMKYYLCRNGDYIRMVMTDLTEDDIRCTLLEALYSMMELDIFGWFRHCGYV